MREGDSARRLPIRVSPLEDEPLESWVEAYATRFKAHLAELWALLLPDVPREPYVSKTYRQVDETTLTHIARVTGVSRECIRQTVPDYLGRTPAAHRGGGSRAESIHHSRWCPTCLVERDLRWKASWRHVLVVACLKHGCLLEDVCPACRQPPRLVRTFNRVPLRGRCDARDRDGSGSANGTGVICGTSLTNLPVVLASEQLLDHQRVLLGLILAPGDDAERDVKIRDAISIVRTRVRNPFKAGSVSEVAGALDAAAAVAFPDRLPAEFHHLATESSGPRPAALPVRFSVLSAGTRQSLLRERDPSLRRTDRLRFASATASPIAELCGDARATAAIAERIPNRLWMSTALAISAATRSPVEGVREAGPTALMLPGTSRTISELALDALGRFNSKRLQHALTTWTDSEAADRVLAAVAELGVAISANETPINYHLREQRVGDQALIDKHTWCRLCDRVGSPAGGSARLMQANAYLYELLTGGDPRGWRYCSGISDGAWFKYRMFCILLEREAATALRDHALDWLERRVSNEPLRWSPPLEWSPSLPAPSPPDAAQLQRIYSDLESGRTPGSIALANGFDLETLRCMLFEHPRPQARRLERPPRDRRTDGALTKEYLAAALAGGKTIREIASDVGRGRDLVARVIRGYELEVPRAGRTVVYIDREWFVAEYWGKRRTLGSIGRELDLAASNVSKRAKEMGVPLRSRGGASHALPVSAQDLNLLEEPLRSALVGQAALNRLDRFGIVAGHPSITLAARTLGISAGTISVQISKLEESVGRTLLNRNTRGARGSHSLTVEGRLLLQQYTQWLNSIGREANEISSTFRTLVPG